MKIETYGDACRYLDDLQMHKIKLGLDAMRATLRRLGSPEVSCPVVHVAGTNGKGSVCSMLRSMLTAAGYRTGLYTSPHLSSVRERFRIDDEYIGEAAFTRHMQNISSTLGQEKITYFECTTAVAFSWFAEEMCDVVILETGLGGRLDATNVVEPLLSVITSISLDHEQYLGNTVEAVAYEKAGIIKNGRPVVSSAQDPRAHAVIEKTCRERNAALFALNRDFHIDRQKDGTWAWQSSDGAVKIDGLVPSHGGAWQLENAGCAIAAIVALRKLGYDISDQVIRQTLPTATWPGRMEYIELGSSALATANSPQMADTAKGRLRFLLDGAHNQAGISYLVETLTQQFTYRRLIVVWASMADKSYAELLTEMSKQADCLILTRPDSERSAPLSEMVQVLDGACQKEVICCDTVRQAMEKAADAASGEDLILVAGSLYLVGAFRKLLLGEVVA